MLGCLVVKWERVGVRPRGPGECRDIHGRWYMGNVRGPVQSQRERPTKLPDAEEQDVIQRGQIFVC